MFIANLFIALTVTKVVFESEHQREITKVISRLTVTKVVFELTIA